MASYVSRCITSDSWRQKLSKWALLRDWLPPAAERKLPDLIAQISKIDEITRLAAGRTLQQILSLRNWLIETHCRSRAGGEDRAQYGRRLVHTGLRSRAREAGCQGLSASNLKNFRQLALAYPELDAINLGRRLSLPVEGDRVAGIRQTSGESAPDSKNCQMSANSVCGRFQASRAAPRSRICHGVMLQWLVRLFTTLTFSHLLELSRIDDLTRRAFYELHCLKERWSVRELQRQRDSLL